MSKQLGWSLIIAVAVLVAATWTFTELGLQHWASTPSLTWQGCVYGKPECSTAAATWLLVLLGLLAFVVGAGTVIYARNALIVETVPRLGQSLCAHHDAKDHPADKELFLTHTGQLLARRPVGVEAADVPAYFTPAHNAFVNLGRTALASVKVWMHVFGRDGTFAKSYAVNVGNIKCEQEIHLTVNVSKELRPFEITWKAATERDKTIEFRPEDPVLPSVELPLNVAQTSLGQLPITAPEPIPPATEDAAK